MESELERVHPKSTNSRHTGLAIVVAVVLALVFYVLYLFLFRAVVSLFAEYDPSFGQGFGAIVLLVFGPNVLGCVSGAIVTVRLFPKAGREGLFYGMATVLTLGSLLGVIGALAEFGTNALLIGIQIAAWAVTIYALRTVLLRNRSAV